MKKHLKQEPLFHTPTKKKLWRESHYFNFLDPKTGTAGFCTIAFRPNKKIKEAVIVLYPDKKTVLARVFRGKINSYPSQIEIERFNINPIASNKWNFSFKGDLFKFSKEKFPPNPLKLINSKNKKRVSFDIDFLGTSESVNFKDNLVTDAELNLKEIMRDSMSANHVEQSGIFKGKINNKKFSGIGERDHAWGIRDWLFPDNFQLFTMFFSKTFSVHCMRIEKNEQEAFTGFVNKGGKTYPVTEVLVKTKYDEDKQESFDLVIYYENDKLTKKLKIKGQVIHLTKVPLVINKNLLTFPAKPYKLLLYEGHAEFKYNGKKGYGLAEYLKNR